MHHIKDEDDILFALKPLHTDWAFRELRDALALVFAAVEQLHELDEQLAYYDDMDALRKFHGPRIIDEQSKEELKTR
jgi:hypothetical protein